MPRSRAEVSAEGDEERAVGGGEARGWGERGRVGVTHEEDEVGLVRDLERERLGLVLERVGVGAQAGGIDIADDEAGEIKGDADVVARGAGLVGDDGDVTTGEGVEQGGLADVGWPEGNDERWIDQVIEEASDGGRTDGAEAPGVLAPSRGLGEEAIDRERAGGTCQGGEHVGFEVVVGFGEHDAGSWG